ncbi:hypothetical protein Q8W71_19085 [Methylobacterium sp. NEAU 140]|uniref:hypothetical protein n=1 Tax=Methylobacterium sp. NEAU 140 TaxID=3064945 RepID=UPI002734FF1F|nr:hypothetical protein [Methylobacterium sp. NEAU 140]MDP4024737.1 hypothetical protein [Methylobacterium sp. NEAU 140]
MMRKKGFELRKSGIPDRSIRQNKVDETHEIYLVHICNVGALREIIRTRKIITNGCRVFKRELNYFFLLKAAYKPKSSEEKSDLLDFFPAAIVLNASKLPEPHHVYPFDSGGAHSGAFNEAYNPYLALDDFELEPNFSSALGHVDWAFSSRKNYYHGVLIPGLHENIPVWMAAPATFLKIAKLAQAGHNRPDSRASAVEVAFSEHVPLVPHVHHLIFPKQFLEDKHAINGDVDGFLSTSECSYCSYDWQPNRMPSDFHREIQAELERFLDCVGAL